MSKSSFGFLLIIISLSTFSCDFLKIKEKTTEVVEENTIVASVKEKKLYLEDLKGLVPDSENTEDSLRYINQYVNSWVKKQLLLNKASSNIEFNNAEMERKVLDYRYALTIHEYQKFYIEKKLNTTVEDEEIENYYEKKNENFILKKNIIRCLFAKIPKEAPKLKKFKKDFNKYPETEIEDLKSYCFTFAAKYSLDVNLWLSFDDVISGTPLVTIPNKVQFLRTNEFIEQEDDEFIYLFKFLEYKFSDQVSPLEFVREDIRDIIINKRKIALKKQLEEEIYTESKLNNEFKIY